MRKGCIVGCFFVFIFFINCSLSQLRIPPLPSQIERIEGYASLRVRGEQGTARSKFSFLFQFPNQGRIEVSNVFGKTLYQIIIEKRGAFFLIPSKKVYWEGEEEEIIDIFLGFRLNFNELVSLLSGQWSGEGMDLREENWHEGWILEKDALGRIIRGRREELRFEVKDFFKNTSVVCFLTFQHPLSSGRLKILTINFNQLLRKEAFSLAFLKDYERKTWAEIEEILNEKN